MRRRRTRNDRTGAAPGGRPRSACLPAPRQPPDRGQRRHREDLHHRGAVRAAGARPRWRGGLRTAAGAAGNTGGHLYRGRHQGAARPHPAASRRGGRGFPAEPGDAAGPRRIPAGAVDGLSARGLAGLRAQAAACRRVDGRSGGVHNPRVVQPHAARARLRQREPVLSETRDRPGRTARRGGTRLLAHLLRRLAGSRGRRGVEVVEWPGCAAGRDRQACCTRRGA